MTHDLLVSAVSDRAGRPWCLFLDRDGVVNTRIIDGYVRSWAEFDFVPGAINALRTLSQWAPRIAVVTNQQGVGKSLMTPADLADIHDRMCRAVANAGGRIDAVLSCPHLVSDECDCRKPHIGLAERYLDAHPELNGALSMMVGDSESDVEMGRRLAQITAGCITIRVGESDDPVADATYRSLADFAAAVRLTRSIEGHPASLR